ncbi:histidinol-phosphatase HisJ family protein [Oscillospiraceae bacterium PP1C4]
MICDYHVHSISPDARVSMTEMCRSACEKKIDELVFTDHYEFYSNNMTSQYFNEEYLKRYFDEIAECQKIYTDRLTVKTGMEFGQLHLQIETADKILKKYPFDYVIGSLHKIANIDLENQGYNSDTLDRIGESYYQELLKVARLGDFDCLGHLDLFKRYARRYGFSDGYEKHQNIIREILKVVISRGKGIEINTSGLRQGVGETMPSNAILEMYKQLGGDIITVGSDAHYPKDIGDGIELVYSCIKQLGFSKIAVYKNRKYSFIKI